MIRETHKHSSDPDEDYNTMKTKKNINIKEKLFIVLIQLILIFLIFPMNLCTPIFFLIFYFYKNYYLET